VNIIEKRIFLIFAIIYMVGAIGFIIPQLRLFFVPLTPIIILASLIASIAFEKKIAFRTIATLVCIGVMGFFLEYAGVKTGKIFGIYSYGKTLGPGWGSVPYLIGINWIAIIYFANNWSKSYIKNNILAALVAALIAVGYDFILEPVAMAYDFWSWKYHNIPMQNYIAWFGISFLFSLLYQSMHKVIKNKFASGMFLLQVLLFAAIYASLKFF